MKQKWENITISISGGGPTAVTDTLNKMGEEGYEAWHMIERPESVIIFMKRPKSVILSPEIMNGRKLT